MDLIKKLEDNLQTRILTFITGDRPGMQTVIAGDAIPHIFKHLNNIGDQQRIHLFLYSTGGHLIPGYGIANMIREFCKEFCVIVPYKAYSTATLIALGANKIIMSRMGQLSPIDPSVSHALGPTVPIPNQPNAHAVVPINVEDVGSYFDLAKASGVQKEEYITRIFEKLVERVHPLALGATNRTRDQIKFLASTLLDYHMKDDVAKQKIVSILSKERFSHDYIITRKEAKTVLGMDIPDVEASTNNIIMDLFTEYNKILELEKPYNPELLLGTNNSGQAKVHRSIIESDNNTHVFVSEIQLMRVQQQPGLPPMTGQRIIHEGWMEDNTV